jgi:uncharacterized UBP type Zn finger protein
MRARAASVYPGMYTVSVWRALQQKERTGYQRQVRRVVWEWRDAGVVELQAYRYADALALEQTFKLFDTAGGFKVDNTHLQWLVEMGFEAAAATRALEAFGNNAEPALEAQVFKSTLYRNFMQQIY